MESQYGGNSWLTVNGAMKFKVDIRLINKSSLFIKNLQKWNFHLLGDIPVIIEHA